MIDFEDTVKMTTVWYKNFYLKKIKFKNFQKNKLLII